MLCQSHKKLQCDERNWYYNVFLNLIFQIRSFMGTIIANSVVTLTLTRNNCLTIVRSALRDTDSGVPGYNANYFIIRFMVHVH